MAEHPSNEGRAGTCEPPIHRPMASQPIECLRCGALRAPLTTLGRGDAGECPRCGYVGWAPSTEVTEALRRLLRDRPPERRHLRVA